jgi:hypothetical protein
VTVPTSSRQRCYSRPLPCVKAPKSCCASVTHIWSSTRHSRTRAHIVCSSAGWCEAPPGRGGEGEEGGDTPWLPQASANESTTFDAESRSQHATWGP